MKLTAAQRNRLPDAAFAGPGRSYPIKKVVNGKLVPDKKHIAAAESYKRFAGPATARKIDAAASAMHSKVATARANASKPLSSLMGTK